MGKMDKSLTDSWDREVRELSFKLNFIKVLEEKCRSQNTKEKKKTIYDLSIEVFLCNFKLRACQSKTGDTEEGSRNLVRLDWAELR